MKQAAEKHSVRHSLLVGRQHLEAKRDILHMMETEKGAYEIGEDETERKDGLEEVGGIGIGDGEEGSKGCEVYFVGEVEEDVVGEMSMEETVLEWVAALGSSHKVPARYFREAAGRRSQYEGEDMSCIEVGLLLEATSDGRIDLDFPDDQP